MRANRGRFVSMVCVWLDSIARCFLTSSAETVALPLRKGMIGKKGWGEPLTRPTRSGSITYLNGGKELVLESASDQNEYLTPIWIRRIGQALSSRVALGWVTSTVLPAHDPM